jgi:hypothetical protein
MEIASFNRKEEDNIQDVYAYFGPQAIYPWEG